MQALPSIDFGGFSGSAKDVSARQVGGRAILSVRKYSTGHTTNAQVLALAIAVVAEMVIDPDPFLVLRVKLLLPVLSDGCRKFRGAQHLGQDTRNPRQGLSCLDAMKRLMTVE